VGVNAPGTAKRTTVFPLVMSSTLMSCSAIAGFRGCVAVRPFRESLPALRRSAPQANQTLSLHNHTLSVPSASKALSVPGGSLEPTAIWAMTARDRRPAGAKARRHGATTREDAAILQGHAVAILFPCCGPCLCGRSQALCYARRGGERYGALRTAGHVDRASGVGQLAHLQIILCAVVVFGCSGGLSVWR
jgi:hypothetical protein